MNNILHKRLLAHISQFWFWTVFITIPLLLWTTADSANISFCCKESNDLYQIVLKNDPKLKRYEDPAAAVDAAPEGSGVLILADGYPGKTTELNAGVFDAAAKKKLRLYVEYPGFLPDVEIGKPIGAEVERAVITSDLFGNGLKKLSIVSINGLKYLPVNLEGSRIVAARVAGFDSAVYGLPAKTAPLLCKLPKHNVMVATTNLSGFVTGRYAPQEAWRDIWSAILIWLDPESKASKLSWTPTVRATYGADEVLPPNYERLAIQRGVDWFRKSNMIVHPSFEKHVTNRVRSRSIPAVSPMGDGKLGSLEAVLSILHEDGTQTLSTVVRGDCVCETAMAIGLGGHLFKTKQSGEVAKNLLDYYHFTSDAMKRERGDPENGNYGLSAWGVTNNSWWIANYGDDNARLILSTLAVAAIQKDGRWDEAMMKCLLANLRTSGKFGFRGNRIDVGALSGRGWRSYFNGSVVNYAPHFEAYLWACYLWAYDQTGDKLFLDRAKTAITMTMKQYTDGWRWTNGLAQERARIILPLAWLVRVEDTPEHRAMLRKAVDGLLGIQDQCGAIREELGLPGRGDYPPPQSNEAYGTNEASLIARNGDPVSDLLYTTNFALLGLHEAAAATGDPDIIKAENKLAEFLCRIQVRSESLPMVDGGWFRAFDFKRWEHWGSNADHGWGAWSIESGWTQGWITSVLAMRQMKTSLWDLTKDSKIERHHKKLKSQMFPPEVLPDPVLHDAVNKPVTYQTSPDAGYPDRGNDLTNTKLGGAHHQNKEWVGWHGQDALVTIDLGKPVRITQLGVNCLRSLTLGIHLPQKVTYLVSNDGKSYRDVAVVERPEAAARGVNASHRFVASKLNIKARYVRVMAKNTGVVPSGFDAAGTKAWLFVDELMVNQKEQKKPPGK